MLITFQKRFGIELFYTSLSNLTGEDGITQTERGTALSTTISQSTAAAVLDVITKRPQPQTSGNNFGLISATTTSTRSKEESKNEVRLFSTLGKGIKNEDDEGRHSLLTAMDKAVERIEGDNAKLNSYLEGKVRSDLRPKIEAARRLLQVRRENLSQ